MDYEKKYKEALERASKLRVQNPFDTVSQMMEYVFPQLAESEDEKMRKNIMVVLANTDLSMFSLDYTFADMVAWLNRKSEKPQDKSTLKAPEGV